MRVHVWGLIGHNGPLCLERVEGNLNAAKYIEILDRNLLE